MKQPVQHIKDFEITELQQKICDLVTLESGLSIEKLRNNNRNQPFIKWRHLVAYLLHEYGDMAYTAIGSHLKRHHATIIHSANYVRDIIANKHNIYYKDYFRIMGKCEVLSCRGQKQVFKDMYNRGSSLSAVIGIMTQGLNQPRV